MTSILIDHGCYDNLGDLAMLAGVTNHLRNSFPHLVPHIIQKPFLSDWAAGLHVTLADDYDVQSDLEFQLGKFLGRRPPAAIQRFSSRITKLTGKAGFRLLSNETELDQFDLLLISGGGYITDVFPYEIIRKMTLIRTFHRKGTPVILTGQQIGPFRNPSYRSIAFQGLKEANFLGIRDPGDSLTLCNKYLPGYTTFDVMGGDSFGLQPAEDEVVEKFLERINLNPGKFIAANVRLQRLNNDQAADRYLKKFSLLIDAIAEELRLPVLFIPIRVGSPEGDEQSARLISHQMNYKNTRIVHGEGATPELIFGLISKAFASIGTSYHFNTFSLRSGVPSICFYDGRYYSQKAKALTTFWGDERLSLPFDFLKLKEDVPRILNIFHDRELRSKLEANGKRAVSNWETKYNQIVSSVL